MIGCSIQYISLLILFPIYPTSMKDKLVLGPHFTLDLFIRVNAADLFVCVVSIVTGSHARQTGTERRGTTPTPRRLYERTRLHEF